MDLMAAPFVSFFTLSPNVESMGIAGKGGQEGRGRGGGEYSTLCMVLVLQFMDPCMPAMLLGRTTSTFHRPGNRAGGMTKSEHGTCRHCHGTIFAYRLPFCVVTVVLFENETIQKPVILHTTLGIKLESFYKLFQHYTNHTA